MLPGEPSENAEGCILGDPELARQSLVRELTL